MAQKVLIVDDSPTIQLMVKSFLRDENVELFSAGNGNNAIELAHTLLPDLMLLDVEMPPPNGFEVCREIKADPATSGVPIIFLTGVTSTAEKVRGLDLGATDYVSKPVEPAELCARVRAALRTKYMTDLLAQRAMLDGLTGLWNRNYLDKFITAEASLARRHGHASSLIMADIDHFKQINDEHGHPFGDEVLRKVARTLAERCRREDVVCRYGGEEFAIVTPQVSVEGALKLAEHLRQEVESIAVIRRGKAVRISCSFGVAELSAERMIDPFQDADAALYRAKEEGRNRVVCAENVLSPC